MFQSQQLADQLTLLKGSPDMPTTAVFSPVDGLELHIDFVEVDSMACALRELRVGGSAVENASFDQLKVWGDDLCRRVTYLLEHISSIEHDAETQTVLIRSTPPSRQADRTTYYEVQLHTPGTLTLRRYRRTSRDSDREQINLQMTHEVLEKLVGDIATTVTAAAVK